jgi:hypothetical protein
MPGIRRHSKDHIDSGGGDPRVSWETFSLNVNNFNEDVADLLNGGASGLPLVSSGDGNKPYYAQLKTGGIEDEAVTHDKLALGSVGNSRIEDNAVTSNKIAPTSVGMGQMDNGAAGGIIRFNSSGRPEVGAQYQGRCFAYRSSDQSMSSGSPTVNWDNRLYDPEGVFAAGVVFYADRAGVWRITACIQLSGSATVRFVVAGSRYFDFQVNSTQATTISFDVLLNANDQIETRIASSVTLKGGSGTSGSPHRSFIQTLYLGV